MNFNTLFKISIAKLGLVSILLFLGCASTHSGSYAIHANNKKISTVGLVISGKEFTKLSSKYFSLLNFTFENKSQEWIKIKNITIDFGDKLKNKNIVFVAGKDIKYWFDASIAKYKIDEYNKSLFLSGLLVGGSIIAGVSKSDEGKLVGAGVILGSLTALTVDVFNKKKKSLETAKLFPKNHLLNSEFVIPPGLFARKWLLINSKNHNEIGYIDTLYITYELQNGKVEQVTLKFRAKFDSGSKWQYELVEFNN